MRRLVQQIVLTALFCLFFFSSTQGTADASFHMRYRAKWRTDYVDGNIGGYLTGTTDMDRPAAYVRYRVYTGSGSTLVISGDLDSNGYTPYFTANNGQNYWLRLETIIEKNGRSFILEAVTMNTTCIQGTGTSYYYNYFVPSGVPDGSYYTVPSQIFDVGYHAGVAPVAARALDLITTFDVTSNRSIRVVGFDGQGSRYQWDDRLCLDWWDPGHQYYKFILAHEFGHAYSDHPDGVLYRGEAGIAEVDTDTTHYCGAGTSHCLISWERIDGAQSEGFANFAAAAFLNARAAASPVYGSSKTLTLPSFIPSSVRTAALSSPWSMSMTTQYKYMENACYWNMVDHGIEWDRQSFFWQIWATGTYKLEVADIIDIWPGPYDGEWEFRKWVEIDSSAANELSQNQLDYFENRAFQNGIDH